MVLVLIVLPNLSAFTSAAADLSLVCYASERGWYIHTYVLFYLRYTFVGEAIREDVIYLFFWHTYDGFAFSR